MLRDFLVRLVAGRAAAAEVEREVRRRWDAGEFVCALPPDEIPDLSRSLPGPDRYGQAHDLDTRILHGESGRAVGVVIDTPPQPTGNDGYADWLVPPHTHQSDHLALVLSGEARFVVRRELGAGSEAVVVDQPVTAGSVVFCPAEAPHTFVTRTGFVVASFHARFVEPDAGHFAFDASGAMDGLPRVTLAEWQAMARRRPVSPAARPPAGD